MIRSQAALMKTFKVAPDGLQHYPSITICMIYLTTLFISGHYNRGIKQTPKLWSIFRVNRLP